MTEQALRYAAYGSNLHPLRLGARTPSARLLGAGFLADRSIRFHKRSRDGSGKCSISTGGSGVHVAVYAMTATDKIVLDGIEGVGAGYCGIRINVPGYGSCFSYVASESHVDDTLVPYDWYKALVIAGASVHRFPGPYMSRLRQVPTTNDPDPDRRRRMWEIVDRVSRA